MTETPSAAAPHASTSAEAILREVPLEAPITRGEQRIEAVTLRKPKSGELRGLSLASLAQLDVDEVRKLLPRISSPTLTLQDVDGMDPADLLSCGSEIVDFLLPKAKRPAYPPAA